MKLGILAIFVSILGSCAKDSDLKALYNDYDNHKVFKIEAEVKPLQETISTNDTLWITINTENLRFKDEITGREVSLSNASFLTQLELFDRIDNQQVVDVQYILQQGSLYEVQEDYTEKTKNNAGFQFGYPNKNLFKVGVMINEPGSYAIWFNNFPNPYQSCKGSNCNDGKGYWYDIFFNWDAAGSTYEHEDFVDYVFNLDGGDYDASQYDAEPYLDYCIYPESVVFIKVR